MGESTDGPTVLIDRYCDRNLNGRSRAFVSYDHFGVGSDCFKQVGCLFLAISFGSTRNDTGSRSLVGGISSRVLNEVHSSHLDRSKEHRKDDWNNQSKFHGGGAEPIGPATTLSGRRSARVSSVWR